MGEYPFTQKTVFVKMYFFSVFKEYKNKSEFNFNKQSEKEEEKKRNRYFKHKNGDRI